MGVGVARDQTSTARRHRYERNYSRRRATLARGDAGRAGRAGVYPPRLRALGVRTLGLFGSYARSDQRLASDVDALVTFDHITFRAYMDVKLLLEDSLGLPVDLVLAEDLRPRLRERILAEVIYVPGLSPLS